MSNASQPRNEFVPTVVTPMATGLERFFCNLDLATTEA